MPVYKQYRHNIDDTYDTILRR